MSTDGQGNLWRRNIAENFNRLSRAHERYRRQTDDRQTDRRWHIANMNLSSRSLKTNAIGAWKEMNIVLTERRAQLQSETVTPGYINCHVFFSVHYDVDCWGELEWCHRPPVKSRDVRVTSRLIRSTIISTQRVNTRLKVNRVQPQQLCSSPTPTTTNIHHQPHHCAALLYSFNCDGCWGRLLCCDRFKVGMNAGNASQCCQREM